MKPPVGGTNFRTEEKAIAGIKISERYPSACPDLSVRKWCRFHCPDPHAWSRAPLPQRDKALGLLDKNHNIRRQDVSQRKVSRASQDQQGSLSQGKNYRK
jgi:hypothetical protein